MANDNILQLVVQIATEQANAALGGVNDRLTVLERQAKTTGEGAGKGMDAMSDKMYQARGAAMMLESQIGVKLPRAINTFLARSEAIGPLLMSAFNATAIFTVGAAIGGAVTKLWDWATTAKVATEETNEFNRALRKLQEELANLRQEYELLGAKGAQRSEEVARRGMEATKTRIQALKTAIDAATVAAKEGIYEPALPGKQIGMFVAEGETTEAEKNLKSLKDALELAQLEYLKFQEQIATGLKQGITERADEARKAAEKLAQEQQELREKNIHQLGLAIDAEIAEYERLKAEKEKLWGETVIIQDEIDEAGHKALVKSYDDFTKQAEDKSHRMGASIVDAWKKSNDEAKRQFESTAHSIENFIDRVFLTARSFSDMWKQLWMQAVGYVIKQFARMAAAWWMTQKGMAATATGPGGGGGGGGGGLGGFLGNILNAGGGGGGVGGTPPFVSSGTRGTGGGMGGLGGFLNMGGWGKFFGQGGGGAHLQDIAAGGTGGGFSLSGLAGSNAATLGGGALAAWGLQHGGYTGMMATAAGGALIGFRYGGPIGAAVGAIIGGVVGTIRMFMKSAADKAHDKIKAAYGVDVQNKGVLQQIVEMAKQGFGGNLDMAIRSQQVSDLIRLYAMTTGQSPRGLPAQMTSATFSQSGGSMSLLPTYSNGLPGSGLNSLGASSAAPMAANVYLSPKDAQALLTQGVARAVPLISRVVQSATMSATRGNFGRRETLALQMSPGTLTS